MFKAVSIGHLYAAKHKGEKQQRPQSSNGISGPCEGPNIVDGGLKEDRRFNSFSGISSRYHIKR